MKKTILLLPLLCLSWGIFAQSVNWFQPSAHWYYHIQSGWVGSGIEHHWINNIDTVVAGKSYQIMESKAEFVPSGASSSFRRVVRQEGKKIYALSLWTNDEVLQYDFGKAVGDTITVPLYFSNNSIAYVITDIDTIQLGGQDRLVQQVDWIKGSTTLSAVKGTFVEGIGAVEGLHLIAGEWCLTESYFFPDEPGSLVVDGETRIFCSYQNDQIHFEGLGETLCATLSTDTPEAAGVTIFPNPSRGTLHIAAKDGRRVLQTDLYDMTGRLLESRTLNGAGDWTTAYKGMAIVVVRLEGATVRQLVFFE